jgi:glycosyltransferase involved in cell wall biosynthesis
MSRCIWYVCKYVAPPGDPDGHGVGGRGYELMRELAALGEKCVIVTSDANHLAAVPEFSGARLLQERDGLLVCWLRTMKAARAKSLRRIGGWLHFEWQVLRLGRRSLPRPDVVIVSSPSLLTVLNGLLLQRRHGVRLVFEVRDIWPLTLVDEGGYGARNPFVRALAWVERLGYRRADAVVGTMPNLGRHVANVLGRERRVDCIPMGYAPRTLERVHETEVGVVRQDRFTVAYAGTIGISNALDPYFAAAQALSTRADIDFLVIGDGALLPHYREQFGHLPNLTFVPKVPKDTVPALLAQCDLLYLSTRPGEIWEYGQSLNKLIDYLLSGRPVLASFSGYPSMIDEADCGRIIPAGDVDSLVQEIEHFAALDPAELDAMGARGRSWVLEHRSYPRLAQDYLEIIAPPVAQGA